MDSERDEIIRSLPQRELYGEDRLIGHETPNAYVYVDEFNRVAILLESGGWLGAHINHIEGDIAPFAG